MDSLLVAGHPTQLWQELVHEAARKRGSGLSEESESYLVFTLMRFLADSGLGRHVLALDYLEGLHQVGKLRECSLRDVGDRCLLLAGLFPEQARKRRVDLKYFCGIGRSAYGALAEELRSSLRSLYQHLATAFETLVNVLLEVRSLSGQGLGLDMLAKHEWLAHHGAGPTQVEDAYRGAIVVPGCGHG